jgi:hypothetical protein
VAGWDGVAWRPLGSGVGGDWPTVFALASFGTSLVVGGGFTIAGGVACAGVARWDGAAWAPLGAGLNSTVRTLAIAGGQLYAGGEFTASGEAAVSHLARWDGALWNELEGGTDNWVDAILEFGGRLYAGGWFMRAGIRPSYFIARWDGTLPSGVEEDRAGSQTGGASELSLRVSGANPARSDVRVSFFLPFAGPVRLTAFDAQGRVVAHLLDGAPAAGRHEAVWCAQGAGEYFLRLQTSGETRTCRVVRVR